jgi:hypothetical protein
MNEEENKLFIQGLNTYYKLKNEYDIENNKQKRNIMKKEELSWKEKRAEYKKLRRKCINCKRPVGTLFSNLYNPEEHGRKLMAVCGDKTNPCPLNIVINLGETGSYPQEIQDLEEEIKELKSNTILDKNDQIFGYISAKDAVEKFDGIKENLNLTISSYEATISAYLEITDSPVINEAIKKLQVKMHTLIRSIKDLIKQFESSNNVSFIKDAVEIYVNQLMSCLNKLNHLQYAYCSVEYDSDDDKFHLIQKKNTATQLETNFSKHPMGVVSLQIGVGEKIKRGNPSRVNKTAKIAMDIPKNTTRRGNKEDEKEQQQEQILEIVDSEEGEGEGEDE